MTRSVEERATDLMALRYMQIICEDWIAADVKLMDKVADTIHAEQGKEAQGLNYIDLMKHLATKYGVMQ